MELSYKTKELLRKLQDSANSSLYNDVKYSLSEATFFSESNTLKLIFLKTEKYRTIERYVQRNYERYPIYSNWKYKTSKIPKSIKINNQTLEELKTNSDYLISKFCYSIIEYLNKEEFVPYWAWNDLYDLQEKQDCKPHLDSMSKIFTEHNDFIKNKESNISQNKYSIQFIEKKLIKPFTKKSKLENKLKKAKFKFRIKLLTKKYNKVLEKISMLENLKNEHLKNIENLTQAIKEQCSQFNKNHYRLRKEIDKIRKSYNEKRRLIKKLPKNIVDNIQDLDFIPISTISSFNQEKITGVYVIRNNENQKYYVGQSKDILRRLKQHFKGNVPHNIIFAEDYYLSKNKENLFSVKVIPLQTKDELDSTEKDLIEKYDSFYNGYNKTIGNS